MERTSGSGRIGGAQEMSAEDRLLPASASQSAAWAGRSRRAQKKRTETSETQPFHKLRGRATQPELGRPWHALTPVTGFIFKLSIRQWPGNCTQILLGSRRPLLTLARLKPRSVRHSPLRGDRSFHSIGSWTPLLSSRSVSTRQDPLAVASPETTWLKTSG